MNLLNMIADTVEYPDNGELRLSLIQEHYDARGYTWLGTQRGARGESFELYNLTRDYPNHPQGSTVCEQTLKEMEIWE